MAFSAFFSILVFFVFTERLKFVLSLTDSFAKQIDGTSINEWRGFFKKEHSISKPYQSSGMHIPNWDIFGSTMVSSQYIRLTPDIQSRQGSLWNSVPVQSKDWELMVTFNVHGSTGEMFGDGLAIWYTQDRGELGSVFGSKDYFRGLGVFLDTYSNHNGPHSHEHPYITAMINNGSFHYDHDRDGTHTQLGGEHTGCEAKFRNKEYESAILVRYVGETLSIFTEVKGSGNWQECFVVGGVRLPTGYFIGFSAATGELSDNQDLIAVRFFEQEFSRSATETEQNYEKIEPAAEFAASPRDHVDSPPPSKLGWVGTIFLVIVAAVVIVAVLGFGIVFLQQRHERARKRFY